MRNKMRAAANRRELLRGGNRKIRAKFALIYALFFIFCFFTIAKSQNLPGEIRGYKVYNAKISVKNQVDKSKPESDSEVFVKVGEPEITDVSLAGITIELPAEIASVNQNGTVDFISFRDFRVNDLSVEIEEYRETFEIRKNRPTILPKPIKIFLNTGQTLRGALKEFKVAKKEWTVTGKVFVFGRFKKSFLKFKRVIPVEINFKIANPLQNKQRQTTGNFSR